MKESKIPTWVIVIIVIFLIIAVICTVGLFPPKFENDQKDKSQPSEEEAERLRELERQNQLILLKAELQDTEAKLKACHEKFNEIRVQERKILFISRLGVGCIIIGFDCLFFKYYPIKDFLGDLLKFNSALVAFYSFTAFISHGTPAKFANYLKSKIKAVLRAFHKTTYDEYDKLVENKALLIEIIKTLENN